MKVKKFERLLSGNYYKAAIIIICLNSLFELIFQYRFQAEAKTEAVYFLLLGIISIAAIKNMVIKNTEDFLPVFYCFWPIIMLFIYLCSPCKMTLFPLLASSFILFFGGRYKQKIIKRLVAIFMAGVVVLIVLYIYVKSGFWLGVMLAMGSKTEVIETVDSFDHKYRMVLEETDFGAIGGYVDVYFGRNIDFGILGCYRPKKIKYRGHWGERPDFNFVNNRLISINGELIERRGGGYLSNNEPYSEFSSFDGKSAEGGEIARYKKENGDILQYKITIYGETGCIIENYYFTDNDTIYYTRLKKLYSAPISVEHEVIISSRAFKEGVIVNGQFYEDEESKTDCKNTEDEGNMYHSLEELNAAFEENAV